MQIQPEDFDRQFNIVVSGAERTRGILYFFCLILIVNIVFFVEDAFNTTGHRLKIMNAVNACLSEKLEPKANVPLRGFEELPSARAICKFYYDYVTAYYLINIEGILEDIKKAATASALQAAKLGAPDRPAERRRQSESAPTSASGPASASSFVMSPPLTLSAQAFTEKYKVVLRDSTDSLSTNVPLLNIKIDRNTGLILQNSLGAFVMLVLLVSLQAERKSLVTIEQTIGDSYFRAKAVLDTHVFSRLSAGKIFLFSSVFAPAAMQLFRIFQDFWQAKTVVEMYGEVLGYIYLMLEAGSLAAVLFLAYRCSREARELILSLTRVEQRIGVRSSPDE